MPLIPKEVVDRIARGENALRAFREWRCKTQLYIAHKTNIGQGYISDLESGRRKGTTTALKKIADVLKLPLDLIAQTSFGRDGARRLSRNTDCVAPPGKILLPGCSVLLHACEHQDCGRSLSIK
jgi:transcriptional regulator with XRE-family HTH domain